MKKISAFLIVIVMTALLCVPVFAADYDFIVDREGVLMDAGQLNEQAQQLFNECGVSFCYLRANVDSGEECNAVVEEVFIPGQTIPDAPALVLVDGGETVFTKRLNNAGDSFKDGVADAVMDAYNNERFYSDGITAYFKAASEYLLNASVTTSFDYPSYTLPRVIDEAGLLTDEEVSALSSKLLEIVKRQQCDIVILTVDSLGSKTATEYADDYYDYNGYGIGSGNDGILFLISMENRDWAISTKGYGIYAFTGYGQEQIIKSIRPYLSDDDFYSAFDGFADKCDELLTMARNKTPLDIDDAEKEESPFHKVMRSPAGVLIALVIGFLIAGIPIGKLKSQINNVKWQKTAADYTRPGSMVLTQSYDNFLYANTTRTVVETDSGSGSRGGGSSTHTSSSGSTHGGSSGKF